jgi:regulator of protease activity HflC (stomatin/prohibitin superfamily)
VTTIILAAIAIFVVLFVMLGFRMVRQAECMVIERLGRYNRTLDSGVNILWPLFDRPKAINWRFIRQAPDGSPQSIRRLTNTIDLRETVYDFPRQNVITRDNVVTEINALLYFQVTDPVKSVYEIADLPDAIEKLTQTTLRNVIGEMDLDETLSSRDTINAKLRAILDQATDKWGVKVNRVELQDINPPQDIRDAMEKQMRAERNRRAVILSAEGDKKAKILEAEGIRESEISKAEGQKKAKVLLAEGEAQAIMKIAEGEAAAIEKLTAALSGVNGDPAAYLIAVRYIEALKDMVTGKDNKVVYIPYEATGVLSSLGGIKDLLQSSQGQD